MTAVAIRTCRRRQIVPPVESSGMAALLVKRQLIGADTVGAHPFCIGVALPTSVRYVKPINRRRGILHAPDIVSRVAADASGDPCVPTNASLPVNARTIFGGLVDAELGIETLHVLSDGMT